MNNQQRTVQFYVSKCFILLIILFLSYNSFAQNAEFSKFLATKQYQNAIDLALEEAEACEYCPNSQKLIQQTFISIINDEQAPIKLIVDQLLSSNTARAILQLQQLILAGYSPKDKMIILRWQEVLNKLEVIAQASKNLSLEAEINLNYGKLCYYTFQMDSITHFYDKAIMLCEKALALNSLKRIQYYQSYIHFQTGHTQDFEKALAFSFKSLQILNNNTSDNKIQARKISILQQIAQIYLFKGDIDRAIEYIQQALQTKAPANPIQKMLLLQQLYQSYTQQGEFNKATALLPEIEHLITKQEKDSNNPQAQGFLTKIKNDYLLHVIQNPNSSPKKINQAIDSLRLSTNISVESSIALANTYIEHNDSLIALHMLSNIQKSIAKANASNMPRFAKGPLAYGNFWLMQQQPQKALDKYQEAITMLMAGANLQEGQDIITSTYDHATLLKILIQKDKAYQALANQDLTQQFTRYQNLKLAIEVIDRLRQDYSTKGAKILLLNNVPMVYNEAIDLLHTIYQQDQNTDWLKEAFELSEKSKAMLLMEALQEDKAHHFGNVPDSLRKQEQSLQKDISFYQAKLFQAQQASDSNKITQSQQYIFEKRTKLEQLKQQLEKNYPKYYQLKHNEQIASIQSIQNNFEQPNQAVIEYMVSDKFVHIFLITSEQISWHKFSKQQLNKPLSALYNNLTNIAVLQSNPTIAYQNFSQYAHQLYQLLIAPLVAELSENQIKELIIIPDGNLTYIPFEVLLSTAASKAVSYKQLDYLFKNYRISYNYSATLWLECLAKAKKGSYNNQLLAFAPNYDQTLPYTKRSKSIQNIRESLAPLSGTQKEFTFLKKHFDGAFYENSAANEQTFKENAHNYGLIHLAMHGVIDVNQPNYSALIFTEDQDSLNDNFLYAYELPSLNLNTQLVVLSACQTGYGKYQNGEGVMSLGRGFMYAGTPSLVMTLWAINDQASAKIMELFYAELKKGLPKRAALQQAKLNYLKNSKGIAAHPAFWSPFVLHGDNTALSFQTAFSGYYWLLGLSVLTLLGLLILKRKSKK